MKRFIFIVTSLMFFAGCASPHYRANKDFGTYFDQPKTIAVLPPDVKIYQFAADNSKTFKEDWTKNAQRNIREAIKAELAGYSGAKVIIVDSESFTPEQKARLEEQNNVYDVIVSNIHMGTYGHVDLPNKINNFDYSLGKEMSQALSFIPADTLLFCRGTNYIWTNGRVCKATVNTLTKFALSGLVGVALSPNEVPPMAEWFCMSLVDMTTGDVLWFDFVPMQGDLRDAGLGLQRVKQLMSNFPRKVCHR